MCVYVLHNGSEAYQDLEKEVYLAIGTLSPLQQHTDLKSS